MARTRSSILEALAICLWAILGVIGSIFRFVSDAMETGRDKLHMWLETAPEQSTEPPNPTLLGTLQMQAGREAGLLQNETKLVLDQFEQHETPQAPMNLETQQTPLNLNVAGEDDHKPRAMAPANLSTELQELVVEHGRGWHPGQRRRYYAVIRGFTPGIYETWEECERQVYGFSGCKFKSFKTEKEACAYLQGGLLQRRGHASGNY